ncbi:thermonuclease family protein [Mariniblastus sp.]|nr:thermonuclease family protein [Mariniblastus sp.]
MEFSGWGRVWEDDTGKHRVVADLVEAGSKAVTLEGLNGHTIDVPIERLSNVDRKYVKDRQSSSKLPKRFTAKVIGVLDGDTVDVLLSKRSYRIRLTGIDAPEKSQDFGNKSKKYLSELVFGKVVSGVTESTDRYGRNLCSLTVNGERIDLAMLRKGLAWHYLKYSKDPLRVNAEIKAIAEQRNLWSERGAVPPWNWRRWGAGQRSAWLAEKNGGVTSTRPPPLPQRSSLTSSTKRKDYDRSSEATRSHWLNTNSNVRHNSSCRWFGHTKNGRPCGANEGKGCGKCGG